MILIPALIYLGVATEVATVVGHTAEVGLIAVTMFL